MSFTKSIHPAQSTQPKNLTSPTLTSHEELGDLASLISYELRTPLTSICEVLGLLHTGKLDPLSKEGQQLLGIAVRNCERLRRLANAIDHELEIPKSMFSIIQFEHLRLENDLHLALHHHQFRLMYQPIVCIETNRTIGFEALVRWQHPQRGMIPPDLFIPIAEKIGLIHPLGLWVLEEACRQLQSWQQQFDVSPPLTVSVNLSTLQLREPNLVDQISNIIQKTNIIPTSLKLEITESAWIEDDKSAIATLTQLKQLGVQLYIDDFGIGYSSLGRLQDLPIDALKIDRSFIRNKNWEISEMIVLLASKLGLDVIAEGVETVEELSFLQTLGCTQMQGYFFSKPIDQLEATNSLKDCG
jgi:EAL domain-containing protein (putative c-di-GMP-specific phosphodiesterase class I)